MTRDSGERSGRGQPGGEVYDWFVRGRELLENGHPAAAAQLLRRAVDAEPRSHAAREALARALFDAREYDESGEIFASLVADDPTDDYARFGLGLTASRSGQYRVAVEHLSLAAAMRPDQKHYATALRAARARLGTGDTRDG